MFLKVTHPHTHIHHRLNWEQNALSCDKATLSMIHGRHRCKHTGTGKWVKWTLRENKSMLAKPQTAPEPINSMSFFSAISTRDGDERKGGGERGREMEREIGVKEV